MPLPPPPPWSSASLDPTLTTPNSSSECPVAPPLLSLSRKASRKLLVFAEGRAGDDFSLSDPSVGEPHSSLPEAEVSTSSLSLFRNKLRTPVFDHFFLTCAIFIR